MNLRARLQLTLLAALFVVTTSLSGVRQTAPTPIQTAPLTAAIPVDPQVTIGQFPNGLKYYIRANKKPEKRAELRLVVKAGSILEDDDQQGLAHVVEHMAFDGTTHFPKNAITTFIQSLGMRFGADLNAYTSFDETVYMLQVPTDKPATMDRAMLILEDWAHNVLFDPSELLRERSVVMEEWRLRRGVGARLQDRTFPIILKGSRYADRIPIGKTEILQQFPPQRLKQFYTDWYRTDLMAVVAVGDFDKKAIENLIKTHFASIPAAVSPKPRPSYTIPDRAGTDFLILGDREATSASVGINALVPARPQGTVGDYRQSILDHLVTGLLNNRYLERSRDADAPFIAASANRSPFFAHPRESIEVAARVKEDGIETGLDGLVTETERASRFGFTEPELSRLKREILRNYERQQAEKDTVESGSRADEYVRNFADQEPIPTIDDEFAITQRFLADITLDEVNKLAKDWLPNKNRIVIVTAPQKAGLRPPTDARLSAVLNATPAKDLKPYVDTVGEAKLLDTLPEPGSIVKTTSKDALGITEWELSNGVKVVLKPTTFKQDEIIFRATSPGGTSLASDADYIPAATATSVVSNGGLAKFSALDLRKILAGQAASASPSISELDEGMSGGASKKDLEAMFQLIHLRFTQPRSDPAAFAVQISQAKTSLANQTASPQFLFADTLTSTLTQNHLRRRLPTPGTVDQWNLEKSLAFYKDRFSDASDFTFVFVGNFELPAMKPLVERYLASLPATHRKETWKDVGVRSPTGVIEKRVEKGIEPQSQTAIVFTGPFEYNQTNRVAIRAMSEVLQVRLLETIRLQLGGTYSITVRPNYQKIPTSEYTIALQFGSSPDRADDLSRRILQEIDAFKKSGPTPKQLADEREALLRDFETNSKDNGYLLGQLIGKYQYGEDPATVWDVPNYYKKLDAAMIQQAAKTYLNVENYAKVTLVPEKR